MGDAPAAGEPVRESRCADRHDPLGHQQCSARAELASCPKCHRQIGIFAPVLAEALCCHDLQIYLRVTLPEGMHARDEPEALRNA